MNAPETPTTLPPSQAAAASARREPAPRTPPAFVAVFWLAVAAALVPTLWPALDLRAAALFAGPTPAIAAMEWWWVQWINEWLPAAFRVLLLLCFMGWLLARVRVHWQAWRMPLAFVVVAGILGPGAVVNLGFKDHWQRARPYQVEQFGGVQQFTRATVITDQCEDNCSFVSGHVACGIFFASLGLLHRRRAARWAAVGVAAGLAVGLCRMAAMAHWSSDVLWAFPITLATSWLVWRGLLRVYGAGARSPSATVG